MGFWQVWSMSAGVMIGSGIFLLPAVLAAYGSISFIGWLFTTAGAICIALTLGRLASRTHKSGGFYVYARDAFGDVAGFLMGWSYWLSIVFATAAIAVAFAGYAGAIFPALAGNSVAQAFVAVALVWMITAINIRGVEAAAKAQLVMTILKIAPLLLVIGLGVFFGALENIPPFNPTGEPFIKGLAATALLTMWAFIGIEAGVVAAEDVIDAKRTIPRAIASATICVAVLYVASTAAVMLILPVEDLAVSEAPFADAARILGPAGAIVIAVGALISTAGSLNGCVFIGAQTAMATARDGFAPKFLARKNTGAAPADALIVTGVIGTVVLLMNYTDGLVAAFTFMIAMSTLATLAPYVLSALAEIKADWRSARGWLIIALAALVYSIIAMAGAGISTLLWGAVLLIAGLPIYYWSTARYKQQSRPPPEPNA
ncbi:APC family permease [Hyphococcus sp.]|uniref:APC family permease n=1 Tax=Hyphococcus sp. TaxID=2038636 RepID=UPI0035C74F6A